MTLVIVLIETAALCSYGYTSLEEYIGGNDGEYKPRGLRELADSPKYRERRGQHVLREYHKICTTLGGLEMTYETGIGRS